MCVIMIVEDKDPTPRIVRDCWDSNAFGAGVAWREGDTVRWDKGTFDAPDELYAAIRELPKPYIVHFRIPTVGATCEELCHPFPLGGMLGLRGSTKDGVIAHNGHWSDWQEAMLKFLPKRIPDGPWSDSRAMAWITQQCGTGFLDLVDSMQKVVLLTPTELVRYGHWSQERGIWFSNLHWDSYLSKGDKDWKWTGKGWKRETAPGVTVYRTDRAYDDDGSPLDDDYDDLNVPYLSPEHREVQEEIHRQLAAEVSRPMTVTEIIAGGATSADTTATAVETARAELDQRLNKRKSKSNTHQPA